MAFLISLFFLVFLLSASPFGTLVHGFTIDLIHRDSLQSPYYNVALSSFDRLRAAAVRQSKRATFKYNFNSEVVRNDAEYLMTVFIGTPPMKIFLIADTGSDVVWTLCDPIKGPKKSIVRFNRKSSRSYTTISCHSASCSSDLPNHHCGKHSACKYSFEYGDKSTTSGILSSETFSFNSNDNEEGQQTVSIPKVLFGCANWRNGTLTRHGSGLVGLGGGRLSLTSQLSRSINSKFSYCLVPLNVNATSKLRFGDEAVVDSKYAVKIPIMKGNRPTYYFLKLEEIIVGDQKVSVPASIDESRGGGGNIVIDSGSTLTSLDKPTFRSLAEKLSKIIKYPTVRCKDMDRFELCYNVSSNLNKKLKLPDITFVFSGVPVKLPRSNTFAPLEKGGAVHCLPIVAVLEDDMFPILGNTAQQNLHIGYDLKEKMLSIAHADCAKLT